MCIAKPKAPAVEPTPAPLPPAGETAQTVKPKQTNETYKDKTKKGKRSLIVDLAIGGTSDNTSAVNVPGAT